MIFIIIGILLLILAGIGAVILVKAKKDEVEGYYTAAQNILKEEKLDSLLKNPYARQADPTANIKTMVYLKFKDDKNCKYVFNLDREVRIGRDKTNNHVCVNEAAVSSNHCRIFRDRGNVFIQDLNSVNGVEIKRKRTRYFLSPGNTKQLLANDIIKIGTTRINIVIFCFNYALM